MEKLKTKSIIIIGGGITGLTLLHFLRRKYGDRQDVTIDLFERDIHAGGTIHTLERGGCLFECGPNGFLDNREMTHRLIRELGLEGEVIAAEEQAALRFISLKHHLHPLPKSPKDLLKSPIFNSYEKIRILCEPLIAKAIKPNESVYDFVKRRFGFKAAEYLADPFISGVYAGDAKSILVQAAFPQLVQWEQEDGSIIKALRRRHKMQQASPMPRLHSFRKGMGQLVRSLSDAYKDHLHLNETVIKVFHRQDRYVVGTERDNYKADELFLCTPAHVTASMIRSLDGEIADDLTYIGYAPVVVIGLLIPDDIFEKRPQGFGYLVPSSQHKEVLGVLFESNIFAQRAPKGYLLLRVMLGGMRHPDIHHKSKKELMETAFREVELTFKTRGNSALTKIDLRKVAEETFYVSWEKAIPQYDQINAQMNAHIELKLKRFRDLYLLGNYRHGVSCNDCIHQAYQYAQRSSL